MHPEDQRSEGAGGCSHSTKQSAVWAPWPVFSCVRRSEDFLGMTKACPHSIVLQGPPIRAATMLSLTSYPTPGPDLKPPSPLKSPGRVNVYSSTNELSTLEVYIFIPREALSHSFPTLYTTKYQLSAYEPVRCANSSSVIDHLPDHFCQVAVKLP